jgi:hypothetical protein
VTDVIVNPPASIAVNVTGGRGPQGPAGPPGPPGDGESAWFFPESYGAEGDGVTDDGDAIRDALAAAKAAGGGTVVLHQKYAFTGNLLVGDGVTMQGVTSNDGPGDTGTNSLKALSATSRILVGDWTTDQRPGGLMHLRIDGNSTGHPDGLIMWRGVHGQCDTVYVQGADGHNVVIDAAQNVTFRSLFSCLAGDAAIAITNGAGGLNFVGCHAVFSPRSLAMYDDDGSLNNGYPYGPAHINWFGGICETSAAVPVSSVVDIRAAANLHFWGTGFSVNGATTSSDEALVKISSPDFPVITTVGFHSCNFNGGTNGYACIRAVDGTNRIIITGDTYWQESDYLVLSDNAAPRVSIYGAILAGSNTGVQLGTINGGSLVEVYNSRVTFDDYRLPSDRATAISVRRDTDGSSGYRFALDRDGILRWNNGTSGFGTKATVSYGDSTETVNISALQVTGRRMTAITQQAISTAAASVTFDSKTTSVHEAYLSGSGSIGTMTITNAVAGAELELWITQDGTGGHTYAWASNIQWIGSAPSATTANLSVVVRLRYHGGLSKWVEVSRNLVSAGSSGTLTSVNGDTGPDVTLDAADVGAAPTSHTHAQSDITGLTAALAAKQDSDAELSALAGLTSAANKLPYFTGSGTASLADLSAFARTLLDDADAATARTTLGITASPRVYEVTTATAAATAAKTATIGGGYAYTDGDLISVVATSGNTAAAATLNIDGLGAKSIYLGGTAVTLYSGVLAANGRWFLRYDSATDRFDLEGVTGNWDIISQGTMETGTSTTAGWMTPALIAAAVRYRMGIRSPSVQTGAYTFVLDDAERIIEHNSASAANYTIPPNSSVAYPIGTKLTITQVSTGQATFVAGAGVTVRNSSSAATRAQWSVLTAYKRGTDEWVVFGDMQ